MARKALVKGLYYITHTQNVPSILERGILSHALVEDSGKTYKLGVLLVPNNTTHAQLQEHIKRQIE